MKLRTNAPKQWPTVVDSYFRWKFERNSDTNLYLVAQALNDEKTGLIVTGTSVIRLFHDGILKVPFYVEGDDPRRAVFVYGTDDDVSARHFAGVTALFAKLDEPAPYYYAPEHLKSAQPANPLTKLLPSLFSPMQMMSDTYAVWWPSPEDPRLEDSPALPNIERAARAFDGYGWSVFVAFGHALGIRKLDAIPNETRVHGLALKGHGHALASFSRERGFRFFFRQNNVDALERNLMWKLFADFAELYRRKREGHSPPVPPRHEEQGKALVWWTHEKAGAVAREAVGVFDEDALEHSAFVEEARSKARAWFSKGDLYDEHLRSRLAETIHSALEGALAYIEYMDDDEPIPAIINIHKGDVENLGPREVDPSYLKEAGRRQAAAQLSGVDCCVFVFPSKLGSKMVLIVEAHDRSLSRGLRLAQAIKTYEEGFCRDGEPYPIPAVENLL